MTTKEAYETVFDCVKDEVLTEETIKVGIAISLLLTKAEQYDAILKVIKGDD